MLTYPLDHIGIAVPDLDEAIALYHRTFGYSVELRERLDSSGVDLAFLSTGNIALELLAPINDSSAISKFLKSRGPGLHHLCYRVDDIVTELGRLSSQSYRLIDVVPRPGARRTKIAFIHPASVGGVLTELCQYEK